MKRVIRLIIWIPVLMMVAACASSTIAISSDNVAASETKLRVVVWPSELFLVRPEGAKGTAVAYSMPGGDERFALPAGMLSANGQHFYAAIVGTDSTQLNAFDPESGDLQQSYTFDETWMLSGVSPTGRWLALTRMPIDEKEAWRMETREWTTDIQIVDAKSGKITQRLKLDGNFEVETISAAGDSLFLVQHLPAVNPDHYLIRLYDLRAETLAPDPLREKKPVEEIMSGLAWDGLASPNGKWLLTLYLNTLRNSAFIHTLDLINRYPVCIDLPSGDGVFNALKHYALALSADGRKVYATNVALGVVAEVNLDELKVTRTITFDTTSVTPKYDPQSPPARSVLSQDGLTLYFADGTDIWAYNTRSNQVSGPYTVDTQVVGLDVSTNGRQLYVAAVDQAPMVLDAASGTIIEFLARR